MFNNEVISRTISVVVNYDTNIITCLRQHDVLCTNITNVVKIYISYDFKTMRVSCIHWRM